MNRLIIVFLEMGQKSPINADPVCLLNYFSSLTQIIEVFGVNFVARLVQQHLST